MGSHRYAGRILETHLNSFRPTLLWLHILHVFFGPDWFLTGRALVFLSRGESGDTRSPCWQTSEVMFH